MRGCWPGGLEAPFGVEDAPGHDGVVVRGEGRRGVKSGHQGSGEVSMCASVCKRRGGAWVANAPHQPKTTRVFCCVKEQGAAN